MTNINKVVSDESITTKIYYVRNQKVMLDTDLAELYQVEPKNLNKAGNRNLNDSRKTLCFS